MTEIVPIDAPDEAFAAVLAATRFGHRGLTFVRTNWPDVLRRWHHLGAAFLALREDGRTIGTYVLVPHDYTIDGFAFRAWYRAGLSVAPDAQQKGHGARLGAYVRERFLDGAPGPTVLYGYVERDNEPSQRVQLASHYAPIAPFEALPVGRLRPRPVAGVEPMTAADRPVVLERLAATWKDHLLGDDFAASLLDEEYVVLRRGGRVAAGVQARMVSIDLTDLPGVSGRLITGLAPALRLASPMFATRPNRHLWLGYAWWDDADALRDVVIGALARAGVAHGVMFVDARSPHTVTIRPALRGLVHRLVPTPLLDVWAGWKDVPDAILRALQDRPLVFSPRDAA